MTSPLPPDFQARCRKVNENINAGQPMTMQNIADALGLPFEFFAAACGLAAALRDGVTVVINPADLPPAN